MIYRIGLPLIFVFLWSSAFIAAKVGVVYATPFTLLLIRFAIVAALFGVMMLATKWWQARGTPPPAAVPHAAGDHWKTILATAIVGVMLHGCYLGSVFLAIDMGVPAGLAALIVSTQPLASSFLAIFLFGEAMQNRQWVGIVLGLIGVAFVLVPTIDGSFPLSGIGVTFFGLFAITAGTLTQKKVGNSIGLLKGNFVQAAAATLFFLGVVPLIEAPRLDLQLPFILAMSWQILAVSLGAYMIFMILIKRNSMAATSSLLFLVPPTTAIMAAIWFGEILTPMGMLGFVLASAGVYMVTRYSSPATP
jgi:drug/metabolite transporter (DMT)-like permease